MCLLLTVTALDPDVNVSRMKRVLKGASSLSVYSEKHADTAAFSLGNEPHCACDLRLSGPSGVGDEIAIVPGASDALIRVAEAVVQASLGPVEFRVFWGNGEPSEALELDLSGFRDLVRQNSFDGRLAYVVAS